MRCATVKDRGAPATAIHVRDIVKLIYAFAILHGEKVANPADEAGPSSIATFVPRERSLLPSEIRIMLNQLEHVATLPAIRLGVKIFLLTMVRKSELQDATWDEVDFENAVWSIRVFILRKLRAALLSPLCTATFSRICPSGAATDRLRQNSTSAPT